MDSRIEELAQIIRERAGSAADNVRNAAGGVRGDRYHSWRQLHALAGQMLEVIESYRKDHPEEYEFTDGEQLKAERAKVAKLQARQDELHQDIVSLRNELRQYREREKTMGWNQS